MSITNRLKITISPIRLHSASPLQIPRSTARFNSLLPTVNVLPLKLHSVSSINLYGASNYNNSRHHLRIRLYIYSHLQRRGLRNAVCWPENRVLKTMFKEHFLKTQ